MAFGSIEVRKVGAEEGLSSTPVSMHLEQRQVVDSERIYQYINHEIREV
jgi:hypothetical protein